MTNNAESSPRNTLTAFPNEQVRKNVYRILHLVLQTSGGLNAGELKVSPGMVVHKLCQNDGVLERAAEADRQNFGRSGHVDAHVFIRKLDPPLRNGKTLAQALLEVFQPYARADEILVMMVGEDNVGALEENSFREEWGIMLSVLDALSRLN